MKQTFLNDPEDCIWLLETHLKPANLNNELPFTPKSFCLFGNEDCPQSILLYRDQHPNVNDKPAKAILCDNEKYSIHPNA